MSSERGAGHVPQKKWGQNFLRNRAAVQQIAEAVGRFDAPLILEIGPGEGVLTDELAKLGRHVLAVEIDPSLARRLQSRFDQTAVEIVNADATQLEFPSTPFLATGNLPYNVATPIIRRTIVQENWRGSVFMVQKEVADRIVAAPDTEPYGYLTLAVGLYAKTRSIIQLGPGSFHPRPKVSSSVVLFEPHRPELRCTREELLALVSALFRMRRKNLLNNLAGFRGLTREEATRKITEAGFTPSIRAEQMSLGDFDTLGAAIGLAAA